jgi:hypothetical protein
MPTTKKAARASNMMVEAERAADITRTTLLTAHHVDIPMRISIGSAAVETTVTGAIALSRSDGHELVSPRMMAMQAGLLLGAAWASEELDRG